MARHLSQQLRHLRSTGETVFCVEAPVAVCIACISLFSMSEPCNQQCTTLPEQCLLMGDSDPLAALRAARPPQLAGRQSSSSRRPAAAPNLAAEAQRPRPPFAPPGLSAAPPRPHTAHEQSYPRPSSPAYTASERPGPSQWQPHMPHHAPGQSQVRRTK